jgi:hypothetical protein
LKLELSLANKLLFINRTFKKVLGVQVTQPRVELKPEMGVNTKSDESVILNNSKFCTANIDKYPWLYQSNIILKTISCIMQLPTF